jgi:hypothetical protein
VGKPGYQATSAPVMLRERKRVINLDNKRLAVRCSAHPQPDAR